MFVLRDRLLTAGSPWGLCVGRRGSGGVLGGEEGGGHGGRAGDGVAHGAERARETWGARVKDKINMKMRG